MPMMPRFEIANPRAAVVHCSVCDHHHRARLDGSPVCVQPVATGEPQSGLAMLGGPRLILWCCCPVPIILQTLPPPSARGAA